MEAEFLYRLRVGIKYNLIARGPIVETSIEQVGHSVAATTCDADSAVAVGSAIAGPISSNVVSNGNDSGLSERQIQGIAAVQRQVLDGRAGNSGSKGGVYCLDLRRFCSDLNGFHDRPWLQVNIDSK